MLSKEILLRRLKHFSTWGICRSCDTAVDIQKPAGYDGPDFCPACRDVDSIDTDVTDEELEAANGY